MIKKQKILYILAALSVIIFLFLLFIYINDNKIAAKLIDEEVSNIDYINNIPKKEIKSSYNLEDVEEVTISSFYKYKDDLKNLKGKGTLKIDSIDLNLPIFAGLNNANLLAGVGEQLPNIEVGDVGNYILAAHKMSYSKNLGFAKLNKVKKGDLIQVIIGDTKYIYKVFLCTTVNNSETQYLDNVDNDKIITLYTCESLYDIRNSAKIVVQGRLIDKK